AQSDTSLECLQDVVIAPGFGVRQNIGHKQRRATERAPACALPKKQPERRAFWLARASKTGNYFFFFLMAGSATASGSRASQSNLPSINSSMATSAAPKPAVSVTRGRPPGPPPVS